MVLVLRAKRASETRAGWGAAISFLGKISSLREFWVLYIVVQNPGSSVRGCRLPGLIPAGYCNSTADPWLCQTLQGVGLRDAAVCPMLARWPDRRTRWQPAAPSEHAAAQRCCPLLFFFGKIPSLQGSGCWT